ncbi:MAG: hypothetical protein ACXV8Q_04005 [Methylobacter sp.]
MTTKSESNLLDQFIFEPRSDIPETIISSCPKIPFRIHAKASQAIHDLMVTFYDGHWYLVNKALYQNRVYVKGLLRASIFRGVDIDDRPLLFVVTYPLSGELTPWNDSVLDVIDSARQDWISMSRIPNGEGYQAKIMSKIDHQPRWLKYPLKEMIIEAFGDNILTLDNLPKALAKKETRADNATQYRNQNSRYRNFEDEFEE